MSEFHRILRLNLIKAAAISLFSSIRICIINIIKRNVSEKKTLSRRGLFFAAATMEVLRQRARATNGEAI